MNVKDQDESKEEYESDWKDMSQVNLVVDPRAPREHQGQPTVLLVAMAFL